MKHTFLLLAVLFLVSKTTLAQVPSYVPSNGLVGWWPFNGNANDESGNGNHGTVNGATLTNDRFGNANSAYNFDGISSFIKVLNSLSLESSNLSISFWIQSTVSQFQQILYKVTPNTAANETYSVPLNLTQSGTLNFDIKNNSCTPGQGWQFNSTSIGTILNWTNFILIHDGVNTKIFQNGQLIFTIPANYPIANCQGGDLLMGCDWNFNNKLNGRLDDIGIWNRALDSCEIKDLYFASLGNCCQASFNSQPQNQNANSGASASFTVQSSSANPIYQWQSDLGLGWQNLSNAGQYSGVNNDTLVVTNLSVANNNQLFRCILTSGTCSDTSAAATLSVSQTNGLNTLQNEIISIYPNPATNQINIVSNAVHYPLSYKVYNELGQALLVGDLMASTTSIDISRLAPGNYMLVVGTKHVSFVKNKI